MITYEIINSILSDVKVMDDDLVLLDIEEVVEQFGLAVIKKTTFRFSNQDLPKRFRT